MSQITCIIFSSTSDIGNVIVIININDVFNMIFYVNGHSCDGYRELVSSMFVGGIYGCFI